MYNVINVGISGTLGKNANLTLRERIRAISADLKMSIKPTSAIKNPGAQFVQRTEKMRNTRWDHIDARKLKNGKKERFRRNQI